MVTSDMVTWDEFYPIVRPMAQECPIGIVDAAIRAACIEFCQKTLIWSKEAACGDIIAGERVYRYNNKNDQVSIVMPLACIIREKIPTLLTHHVLAPTNRQDMDFYEPGWRLLENDVPKRYFMVDSNTVCLVEKPKKSIDDGLHLLCAVKPNRNAEGIAAFIFEDWAEEIAYGALARIHAMMGRVWANPQLVTYYQSKFRAAISRAKSKMLKSYVAQSKSMLPVAWDTAGASRIVPGSYSIPLTPPVTPPSGDGGGAGDGGETPDVPPITPPDNPPVDPDYPVDPNPPTPPAEGEEQYSPIIGTGAVGFIVLA
jgi:hypothetical protein